MEDCGQFLLFILPEIIWKEENEIEE